MAETALENAPDEVGSAAEVPWHYWAVTGMALLWNAFPAVDFTLTQMRLDAWVGQVDPAMLATVYAAPLWATAAWAVGAWGGLLGAIALLVRSRFAVHGFAMSLAGACVSFAWQFAAGLVATPVLPAIIVTSELLLLLYARSMREGRVLR